MEAGQELACGSDGRIVAVGAIKRKEHHRATTFRVELQALQSVQHENIVALAGACCESLCLYLPRYDLDLCTALLAGRGDIDGDVVASSLLSALCTCHRTGLVHRDVKPENVLMMLPESGKPAYVLCDFARSLELPPEGEVGVSFCGTRAYGAPEALRGRFFRASDVFSAGCLLFAVALRELPYEDEDLWSEEEVPPPLHGEVDERQARLLRALLRWDPSLRPTAEAALALLRDL